LKGEKIKKSNNIFDSEMKENVMRNEISIRSTDFQKEIKFLTILKSSY